MLPLFCKRILKILVRSYRYFEELITSINGHGGRSPVSTDIIICMV